MLTNVRIENFRAFDGPTEVRIRPVTILVGRNSAGKSSLVKFLLVLRQSVGKGNPFLVTEGEDVHLGTFDDLRNSNSDRQSLRYELTFEGRDLADKALFRMKEKRGKTQASLELVLKTLATVPSEKDARHRLVVSGDIKYGTDQRRGLQRVLGLRDDTKAYYRTASVARCGLMIFPPRVARGDFDKLSSYLSREENQPLQSCSAFIKKMRHLGAVREEFQRAIVSGTPAKNEVGKMGEYTLTHMQRILETGGDAAKFLRRQAANVGGIDQIRFGKALKGYLALGGGRNKATGARSYLADFGFGVSQFLPVIVQGALMQKGETLMVEQPESQLHPTAQLECGSFFAALWLERGVRSIVETHSANLLLRIRHLVAQGKLKPDDVSIAYFCTDTGAVVVRNLDIKKDGSLAKGLPMEFFGADLVESLEMGMRT